MAPTNKAAILSKPKAYPIMIGSSPYPTPGDGEIVVKVAAAAINPIDWYIQIMGEELFAWLQYPYIGGSDVAGSVVEVGPNVSKFKVGDRVLGFAAGFKPQSGDDLDYTDASVKDFLALDYPSLKPKPNGKTLLIWAGASSVGTNAIQLAVASGYEVYTTSSPKNFDYCKELGAARVFDYHSPNITQDLIEAFKGKICAGGFAIQLGSEGVVFEVVDKSEGAKIAKMVFAGTLKDNEVGPIIFDQFLPAALAQKKYQCLPKPLVVGHGLEHVQAAIDQGKSGAVSARKLVITL
ncbi:GroES-like protein [Hypoxylon sp. NC0597]|nr:GroES-like protein [Hypoxylon sp. NC0597]